MKTAEQLGISKREFGALRRVRDGLRSGRYVHTPNVSDPPKTRKRLFNMKYDSASTNCGTAACIGGWMAKEMRKSAFDCVMNAEGSLKKLFFPQINYDRWDDITPKQAVTAINNFLKTGNPKWREATRKSSRK